MIITFPENNRLLFENIVGECSDARTRPKVGSGVRQECPLSLLLFTIYIE